MTCEDRVIEKIKERQIKGFAEHGATMERTDYTTKQWLIQLQGEMMDAAIYIERLLQEKL